MIVKKIGHLLLIRLKLFQILAKLAYLYCVIQSFRSYRILFYDLLLFPFQIKDLLNNPTQILMISKVWIYLKEGQIRVVQNLITSVQSMDSQVFLIDLFLKSTNHLTQLFKGALKRLHLRGFIKPLMTTILFVPKFSQMTKLCPKK